MTGWEELEQRCNACSGCTLAEHRTNVVIGTGDRNSALMFVGEGPGEQEDLSGIPFVGPAGHLLDDLLLSVGITRPQVYIANIVKCRPPHNRDPRPEEQDACIGYLRRQVALIRPKLLVCLGRIAAQRIIDPEFRITRDHGVWFDRGSYRIMATYHPSALLRDVSKRPDAYDDFTKIAAAFAACHTEESP